MGKRSVIKLVAAPWTIKCFINRPFTWQTFWLVNCRKTSGVITLLMAQFYSEADKLNSALIHFMNSNYDMLKCLMWKKKSLFWKYRCLTEEIWSSLLQLYLVSNKLCSPATCDMKYSLPHQQEHVSHLLQVKSQKLGSQKRGILRSHNFFTIFFVLLGAAETSFFYFSSVFSTNSWGKPMALQLQILHYVH